MKNVVMPSSEDLNAKFKFFLTMMFAAQNAHKHLLEASFKEQAETINLLHKSKYGSRVPEKYHKITKEEIQEMIKDMGWSEPQPSTSKRPLESVEESEEDRNAKKTKRKSQRRKQRKLAKVTARKTVKRNEMQENPKKKRRKKRRKTAKVTARKTVKRNKMQEKQKKKRKTQKRKPRNKVTLGRESTTRSASVHCVIELLRT